MPSARAAECSPSASPCRRTCTPKRPLHAPNTQQNLFPLHWPWRPEDRACPAELCAPSVPLFSQHLKNNRTRGPLPELARPPPHLWDSSFSFSRLPSPHGQGWPHTPPPHALREI